MSHLQYKKLAWDANHEKDRSDYSSYVTDLTMQELCQYHDMAPPTGKTITYIGVGHGGFCKVLQEFGNTVYGVDISSVALLRAEPYCKQTILSQDLSLLPPCDLAIAHLVIQHNPEAEVFRLIQDINLAPDGEFSFQFAYLTEQSKLSPLLVGDLNINMLHFYSIEKMKSIIANSNKRLVYMSAPFWFGDPFNFEWTIMRVANGTTPR